MQGAIRLAILLCHGPLLGPLAAHAQEAALSTSDPAPVTAETVGSGSTEGAEAPADDGPTTEPVLTSPRPRPLGFAMDAVRRGSWQNAARIAARDGEAAAAVVEWHRLRAGLGNFAEAQAFLAAHPDWPGLGWLRRQAEAGLKGVPAAEIAAFFADEGPQTPNGVLSYAAAMRELGEPGTGEAEVVLAFRSMEMTEEQEAEFMGAHAELVMDHVPARIDWLVWQKEGAAARRLLPLVDADTAALAEARLALLNGAGDAEDRIAALPPALRADPGLAYARFEQLRGERNRADAVALILDQSASDAGLGEPERWAGPRADMARDLLHDGAAQDAYDLAANHGLTEGSTYAQLEWLAGYIALQALNQPVLAASHFERFTVAVETPISLGRAGYWLGRAYEAAGQPDKAQAAFEAGGAHQTAFYGLLAAERAGMPPDPLLTGAESFLDWRDAAFTRSSVFEAARLLYASGERQLAERFFLHLAEGLDRETLGTLGSYFRYMEDPHLEVMLGKRAAQFGHTLAGPYYALHPLHLRDNPVPDELMLAIARRESEFDPVVVSGAGARGLMQLMPGTAQEVAGELDLPYDRDRLTADPLYNAQLGGRYLQKLARQFDGNIVMMAAGYNAGPSRPIRWMKEYGDPRAGEIDIVDWIETIPFDETRNYVMRVAESLPVYRARLGRPPLPVPFSEELTGGTMAGG